MADASQLKQLKIKFGSVTRNVKDLQYANAEVQRETVRLSKFETEDPDKVSQQKKVIQEAEMMVPHALNRIRRSVDELAAYLEENEDVFSEEERKPAEEALLVGQEAVGDE